ncbi:hypothetical protein SPH9361_03625 [Sphingobium sp. CECT 9361]|nr:hypothetical protein SPH9361_03625 [Sphingobium sp. CECT 9361]
MRRVFGGSVCVSAVMAVLFSSSGLYAQEIDSTAAAKINADDAEQSFRYAADAAAAGNIVGAISALERVLQNNPDLDNVKLELGLLYLRAGNVDLAKSYLRQAVNSPNAPGLARERARIALGSANGGLGGFTLSGSLFAGTQVQSNPNGSPGAVSVAGAGGIPIIISGDDLNIPRGTDVSASLGGSLQLRYGLNSQRGNDIVADMALSQTNYNDTTELDATYVNARIGPRFFTGPANAPTGFIRPVVTGTFLALGHARYFGALGGGIEFLFRPSIVTNIAGQISVEKRDFHNSRRRPTAEEQGGTYTSGSLDLTQQLSARMRVTVGGLFEHVDANRSYWSRSTFGGQVGALYAFGAGAKSVLLRANGSYRRSDYDAADPLVDALKKRDEDRFDLELLLSIPMTQRLSMDLRGSQVWNTSNLPNYDYKNTLGAVGVSYRF